ncbi:MAG: hypothetical protein ACOC9T_00295 [Myxococcota bacterium]
MARYLARDTFLEQGDGASEETFARVAQVISFDGPNMTSEFAEFDDHDVEAGFVEKLKTKLDAGQLSFTVHYDPADPTHIALEDEYKEMETPANWRFHMPTAEHERRTKSFSAFVSELGPITSASDGKLERSMTLELTGEPEFAAG